MRAKTRLVKDCLYSTRTAHTACALENAGLPLPRFLGSRSPTQRLPEQEALKAITKKDAPAGLGACRGVCGVGMLDGWPAEFRLPVFGSPRCLLLFLGLRGGRSGLWGRARPLEAVTARGVDVTDAHSTSFSRAGSSVPFPSGACGFRGLCVRRRHPDDYDQNAQARDQSALHDFLPSGSEGNVTPA